MQPLVSPVDHESRVGVHDEEATEESYLLARFSPPPSPSRGTVPIVVILLLMLLLGVTIGVYLLMIQFNSENILPPVEKPLQLVSRRQWQTSSPLQYSELPLSHFHAKKVIAVQTDSEQCFGLEHCIKLLNNLQKNSSNHLSYNFLVGSRGETYEALGWRVASPLYPEYGGQAMVVAFIGTFTEIAPSRSQIQAAKGLIAESMSKLHLSASYILIGRRVELDATKLFHSLSKLPRWDRHASDM